MADDIDDLCDWARSEGFEIRYDANGYRRFYTSGGKYIGRYPATPGRGRRRYMDVLVALKAHGLAWPPPSKKEQRSKRNRKESS